MRIYRKKEDIINAISYDLIAFPMGLYKVPDNTILKLIANKYNNPFKCYLIALELRKIDVGQCYCQWDFDNNDRILALMISCFNVDEQIDEHKYERRIDYEMLYSSLQDLCCDVLDGDLYKIAFCMNDLIDMGCDESIFEAMVKSVFSEYNGSITFMYGK